MSAPAPIGDLRLIPLADLSLSSLNSRQTVSDAEVEAMADSIAHSGLLQNLIGFERFETGRVEIVGGGKRLRALQKLAAEGFIGWPSTGRCVPVKVTVDPDLAVAWAGAENAARSDLHPADEIAAYAALRLQGKPISLIAATFAVPEAHVARQLRLATLPEPVLANLRANKISIEQARAFTRARDDKSCIDVLGATLKHYWGPHQIKHALTPDTISARDRRVRFVGTVAYRAAGGAMTEDLFDGGIFLHDEKLLDRLVLEKGIAATDAVRVAEGWAWAEFKTDTSVYIYDWSRGFTTLQKIPGELSDADLADYDALSELANGEVLDAAGEQRLAELQARLDGDFSDEDYQRGGIFCFVDHDGTLAVARAFVRKDDTKPEAGDDGGNESPAPAADKPEAIPQNLKDDLRAIRLRAIQTQLFDQHEKAMDLLAFSLTSPIWKWNAPLSVSADPQTVTPTKPDGLNDDARFADADSATKRSNDIAGAFTEFRTLGKAHRNKALTHALARSWRLYEGPMADLIAAELKPNPRAIWTPTASNYFGRLPVPMLDRIWEELTSGPNTDPVRAGFARLKKAQKAKELEKLFMDMGYREALGTSRAQNAAIDSWLPPELRFGDVKADEVGE